MKDELHGLFSEVLKNNHKMLKAIEPYDHPILILLRESIKEQQNMLEALVVKYEEVQPDLKDIKRIAQFCTLQIRWRGKMSGLTNMFIAKEA